MGSYLQFLFLIGYIYLGLSTAFNIFISTGLVLQYILYTFPAALLIYRKQSSIFLSKSRQFRLPGPVGWAALNILTVIFAVLVLIFYDFLMVMPVIPSNMSTLSLLHFFLSSESMTLISGDASRLYICCSWRDGHFRRRELGGIHTKEVSWPSTSRVRRRHKELQLIGVRTIRVCGFSAHH